MEENKKLDFMLGSLAPGGFVGYFDHILAVKNGWRTMLIKAGPGSGKSTLMRTIAENLTQSGETVELIHCSSDPDSLDGVICKAKKFCMFDATAPHTLEPQYPIASEDIVSLYEFFSRDALRAAQSEIVELFTRCSSLQERAMRYVTASSSLFSDNLKISASAFNKEKAKKFAEHLADKYIPQDGLGGEESLRLLSANTAKGIICYDQSVTKQAKTIIVLNDDFGAASKLMMRMLHNIALERGHDTTTCYCSLSPWDKIEHIIMPELSLAFVTSNNAHTIHPEGARVIHCKRFYDKDVLHANKARLKFNNKAARALLDQASALQTEAKKFHDKLEAHYIAAADFSKLDKVCENIIAML